MSTLPPILVLSRDPAITRAVREVAESSDRFGSQVTLNGMDELAGVLDQQIGPTVVVVDIDERPAETLLDLQPLVDHHATARFLVVASEQQGDLVLKAMQAGVRDFLVKSSIATDLPVVFDRLAPAGTTMNGAIRHAIVTVLSAGGGTGATTIAINLAQILNESVGRPALLVDLDCTWGGAAGLLGMPAEFGLAQVLADDQRIDAHLIRSTTVSYNEGLHLLVGAATTEGTWPVAVNYEHMPRALRAMRQAYAYTVIDAPCASAELSVELARASALTLIVLQDNVEDIRIGKLILKTLLMRSVSPERVLPVVNRYRRRSIISLSEVSRALGVSELATVSNDYKGVVAALNYGKTMAEAASRSAARRDIERLALRVLDPQHAAGSERRS